MAGMWQQLGHKQPTYGAQGSNSAVQEGRKKTGAERRCQLSGRKPQICDQNGAAAKESEAGKGQEALTVNFIAQSVVVLEAVL